MNQVAAALKVLLGSKFNVFESRIDDESNGAILFAKSPSSEVGEMSVHITEDEITIRIGGFHKHINSSSVEGDETFSISSIAADIIGGILDGKYYFFGIYDDGSIKSSGGGPMRLNDDEKKLLVRMFGNRISIKEWNWFGSLK